ncbi:MAG: glycosyltransferase family 2 protein [Chloroflexota bacterium]|jgi:cellulose synthase/poly-beta-1,6-N-acetylglucosamine synthase-like glycosyltransferase
MTTISLIALLVCALPLGYLFLLALASIRSASPPTASDRPLSHRFVIAIPAHDEASVVEATVQKLRELDYPADLFSIHIVADHCSDNTAVLARQIGAFVHERNDGPRTGKGAALSWLFQRVLDDSCDAVVIFDCDTQVAADFLRIVDADLARGDQVIQGQHVISNPESGWFPALMWAMFLIDNRFQNLGRSNLGWSAKHMGDSICFRADVLRKTGWGEGLTEDYQLRQCLLLEGIRITYEPAAIGRGEAPRTWTQAQAQRARWLRGTHSASQRFARHLLVEGIKRWDTALLDGALQAYLPSYSTLTLIAAVSLLIQALVNWLVGPIFPWALIGAWAVVVGVLFVYPLIGLALEKASLKAYLAILSGPVFILWRTWLALVARLGNKPVTWIRTAHGEQ